LCDRVVVMHHGVIVEQGTRNDVLHSPSDAYTRRLIASAPVPDPELQRQRRQARLAG
jgi:peptide/nickel transport system ATP-binding protein